MDKRLSGFGNPREEFYTDLAALPEQLRQIAQELDQDLIKSDRPLSVAQVWCRGRLHAGLEGVSLDAVPDRLLCSECGEQPKTTVQSAQEHLLEHIKFNVDRAILGLPALPLPTITFINDKVVVYPD